MSNLEARINRRVVPSKESQHQGRFAAQWNFTIDSLPDGQPVSQQCGQSRMDVIKRARFVSAFRHFVRNDQYSRVIFLLDCVYNTWAISRHSVSIYSLLNISFRIICEKSQRICLFKCTVRDLQKLSLTETLNSLPTKEKVISEHTTYLLRPIAYERSGVTWCIDFPYLSRLPSLGTLIYAASLKLC